MVPQLRNPVVDGREEGGGVGDAIAEQEDVRLPVGKIPRRHRPLISRGVQDGKLHPISFNYAGCAHRLKASPGIARVKLATAEF